MDAAPPSSGVPPLSEFDLSAWRVLGAGSLLLDVRPICRSSRGGRVGAPTTVALGRWKVWWTRRKARNLFVRKGERRGRRGRRRTD